MGTPTVKTIEVTDFEDYKTGVTDFVLAASKVNWTGPGDATDFIEVRGKKHTLKFVKYWETSTRKLSYFITIASMNQFKEAANFKINIDFSK